MYVSAVRTSFWGEESPFQLAFKIFCNKYIVLICYNWQGTCYKMWAKRLRYESLTSILLILKICSLDVCLKKKHVLSKFWERQFTFWEKHFLHSHRYLEKKLGEKQSVLLPHSGVIIWLQTLFEFRALVFTLPKSMEAFFFSLLSKTHVIVTMTVSVYTQFKQGGGFLMKQDKSLQH